MDILSIIKILIFVFLLGFYVFLLVSNKRWCNYVYLGICLIIFIVGLALDNKDMFFFSILMVVIWLVFLGEKWRNGKIFK